MSQIFDALLRAETERNENDPMLHAGATALLQHVENQVMPKWTAGIQTNSESAIDSIKDSAYPEGEVGAVAIPFRAADVHAADQPVLDKYIDISGKFESLSIATSPSIRLVSLTDIESASAEAYRLLSVRLRDIRRTRQLQKILITSSNPQEGKSTTAANLACALSHSSGDKILLIEGDLRKPSLAQMFGLGRRPGICEWIQGANDLPANIYYLKEPNVWIFPAGKCPAAPLELLQSTKLPQLMDQLTAMFDWIIVDSPPVLPLADTSVWARMTNGILLVARRGITEKKQLIAATEALDPEKLIGSVLNGSKSSVYSRYYYKAGDEE